MSSAIKKPMILFLAPILTAKSCLPGSTNLPTYAVAPNTNLTETTQAQFNINKPVNPIFIMNERQYININKPVMELFKTVGQFFQKKHGMELFARLPSKAEIQQGHLTTLIEDEGVVKVESNVPITENKVILKKQDRNNEWTISREEFEACYYADRITLCETNQLVATKPKVVKAIQITQSILDLINRQPGLLEAEIQVPSWRNFSDPTSSIPTQSIFLNSYLILNRFIPSDKRNALLQQRFEVYQVSKNDMDSYEQVDLGTVGTNSIIFTDIEEIDNLLH